MGSNSTPGNNAPSRVKLKPALGLCLIHICSVGNSLRLPGDEAIIEIAMSSIGHRQYRPRLCNRQNCGVYIGNFFEIFIYRSTLRHIDLRLLLKKMVLVIGNSR